MSFMCWTVLRGMWRVLTLFLGSGVSVKTVMVSDTKHKIQKKTKRKTNSAASSTKPTWNNSNKHMCT